MNHPAHDAEVCGLAEPWEPPSCPACLQQWMQDRGSRRAQAGRIINTLADTMNAEMAVPWTVADVKDFAATLQDPHLGNIIRPALIELLAPVVADMIEASKTRKRA